MSVKNEERKKGKRERVRKKEMEGGSEESKERRRKVERGEVRGWEGKRKLGTF